MKPIAKFTPIVAEEVPDTFIAQETSGHVAGTCQPNISACLEAIGSSGQDGCSQPSLGPTDPHPKASVCPPAGPTKPKVWLAQEPTQLQSSPAPTAFLEPEKTKEEDTSRLSKKAKPEPPPSEVRARQIIPEGVNIPVPQSLKV